MGPLELTEEHKDKLVNININMTLEEIIKIDIIRRENKKRINLHLKNKICPICDSKLNVKVKYITDIVKTKTYSCENCNFTKNR